MQPPKPSPKEARAERRNLAKLKEDEKKARFVARLIGNVTDKPRISQEPSASTPEPRQEKDPNIIFRMKMTWCITRQDVDGVWSWREPRKWSESEFQSHIQQTLNSLTGNTWAEIGQMIRDGLEMHHSQSISTIHEEAQKRWGALEIETDEAYRFSLTGRQRAWGFRQGAHFHMVWYDRHHTIYRVQKSGT